MTVMFADDFKGYGTTIALMLNGLYAQVDNSNLVADPDPLASGNVFETAVDSNNGIRLRRVFPAAVTHAGFLLRLWMDSLPSTDQRTLGYGFSNNSNVMQFQLGVSPTGAIVIRDGSFAVEIGRTAGPVLLANAWNHIELDAVASATVGTMEVRVNGVSVLTLTNVNTGTQYSQFRIDNPNSSGVTKIWYAKDLVTRNASGTQNTGFMGTVSVVGRTTASDVAFPWTASHGTVGWSLLDNSPPVDNTDFITAPFPAPAASIFTLTNLPINVTSVRAMITQVRARKVDGGDGNLQASLISSGDTADGSDRPITTAFTYYEDVFEVDPHTAAAWTPAAANAAEFKINRTV